MTVQKKIKSHLDVNYFLFIEHTLKNQKLKL